MQNNERKVKNSKARIKANDRYNKANYKNISIRVKPDQAEEIRATAEKLHQSLAQLIINAVRAYADIQTAEAETPSGTADTAQPEQPEQPENVTTESPMKSGETAGAQPEELENETDNEIETEEEETTEEEEEEEEEPEEDEDIPEELKAVRAAWARMEAFNEKITAERKRREAEERERRREITDEERYMMR